MPQEDIKFIRELVARGYTFEDAVHELYPQAEIVIHEEEIEQETQTET